MPALYVVRHGEPEGAGRLLGCSDPPLTLRGREQAGAVLIEAARFFSSTLRRASESAALCARGNDVNQIAELDEISLGEWNGLTWHEIEARWPALAHDKLDDWLGVTPPGGERWSDFTARVDRALDIVRQAGTSAAVIAHLTVNSWIAHRLSGCDPIGFRQEYAQVYTYEF